VLRYVSIAMTTTCLVLSTLAIASWIRSYTWLDYRTWESGASYVVVHSQQGQIRCFVARSRAGAALSEPLVEAIFRETFALPNSPHLIPAQWPAQHTVLRQFQWTSFADGVRVVAPHWVLAFVFGTAAAIPWVRRFRLRTLLLATAIVAVILGVALRASVDV
jgi:hypothetical protein